MIAALAELAPAPAAPARIEPLHTALPHFEERIIETATPSWPRNTWAAYVRALAGPIREMQAGLGAGHAPPMAVPGSSADLSALPTLGSGDGALSTAQRATPAANTGPRYRVQLTVDQTFVDLLEEARDLLQHSIPSRDVVEVQRRALQLLVKKLRARQCAATDQRRAPGRPSPAPEPPSADTAGTTGNENAPKPESTAPARRRHIPAAVRRAVCQRDAVRCTYTDARGQRCRERAGLQLHHLEPHVRGGPDTVDNLTLRCRAHNALAAEQDFGSEWMLAKAGARRAGAVPLRR